MTQKAVIDANLEQLVNHLKQQKHTASQERRKHGQIPWMRPPVTDAWDGGQEPVALHVPFNTDEAEQALREAYKPKEAGNVGDTVVLTMQIDYAAQAERAYRARIGQSFARSIAHVTAREKGHGSDTGAIVGSTLNYFNLVLKKGGQPT
jgi:hypothetical protein